MTENNVVKDNMVVSMAYKLTVDGEVLDQAGDLDAIEFLVGHQNIIPGLESQLAGMKVGDSKAVVVDAEGGYGTVDEDAIEVLGLDEFSNGVVPEVGLELEMRDEKGEARYATVVEVSDKDAKLDFNHPLAGKDLHFDVKIVKLREPTEEELSHGHVHSHGGHNH